MKTNFDEKSFYLYILKTLKALNTYSRCDIIVLRGYSREESIYAKKPYVTAVLVRLSSVIR